MVIQTKVPTFDAAGARTEMTLMRSDMPPPPRTGGPPVTNIRRLVPFNSIAEVIA
ncbi:hypothetical protein Q2941_16580 [Bradyrhizobium sp. UFLA05-153]